MAQNNFPERNKFRTKLKAAIWFAISAFLFAAILSYSQNDASFNRASDSDFVNVMGKAGAYVIDPLLQSIGLSAAILALASLVWGIRTVKAKAVHKLWVAIPAAIFMLLSFSSLCATLPTPEWWPFYVGLGGIIGDLIIAQALHIIPNYIYFLIASAVFLPCLYFALSMDMREVAAIAQKIKFTNNIITRACYIIILVFINLFRKMFKKEPIAASAPRSIAEQKDIVEYVPEAKKKKPLQQISLKLDTGQFQLPDPEFLTDPARAKRVKVEITQKSLEQNAKLLKKVLEDFGVQGEIVKVRLGPVVTLYELEPAAGTKSSRVIGLSDDIARSMSAISARIAVVPGRNILGIELPNADREVVYLRELLEIEEYRDKRIKLPIALGKDIGGEPVTTDLARMPHLLIAGTTGSGKSVAVNAMILSFLYRLTPDECKFIMIDPKMLELSVYDGIPHLIAPVVTEPGKAVVALKWAVREMENRYRLMSNLGVRNITGYNKAIEDAVKAGQTLERKVQTGFNPETGEPVIEKQPLEMVKLPLIVVIVDEMADLMLTAGKEIESSIQRLAQMARAAGIHMVMATQRPSVDVITGVIKANFPTRISFQVTSRIDSRTILGEMGAEQLLGMGDMLYMAGGGRITRVHGPFVDDKEVEKVVAHLKLQGPPQYIEDITKDEDAGEFGGDTEGGSGEDVLYDKAVAIVLRDKKPSISYVQRQLRIGYNKAANLIERMEREGVISQAGHAGKREVLVN
jgi:S-DNA-T family DNA segregation ATPase FtsK/SpoIIIE